MTAEKAFLWVKNNEEKILPTSENPWNKRGMECVAWEENYPKQTKHVSTKSLGEITDEMIRKV